MIAQVQFTSDAFNIVPGEDEETNPGIYGIELARWIKHTLPKYSVNTKEVLPEDFAWLTIVQSQYYYPWIACSNQQDKTDQWFCILTIEGGFISRILRPGSRRKEFNTIFLPFIKMLENEDIIREIHWTKDA